MLLGITTSPRPDGAFYLQKTVNSAIQAGFDDIIIFAEPDSPAVFAPASRVSLIQNQKQLGNYGNFASMAALLLGFSRQSTSQFIVTAEDDVVFCRNAREKISDKAYGPSSEADFGFFAAYSSSCHQDHVPENSVAPIKTSSLWGACCLVWTPESLAATINHFDFRSWRGLDDNKPSVGDPRIKHVDTCISKVLSKLGHKMWFCNPSLVRHIGKVSSLRKIAWTAGRDCEEFEDDQKKEDQLD